MGLLTILLVLYMTTLGSSRFLNTKNDGNVSNVMNFGAIGDGKTDDSQAFLKAWEVVCQATSDGPTLNVPNEKTFLLKPVKFEGPCKSTKINFQIMGNIVATNNSGDWEGHDAKKWIEFSNVDGLNVTGNGQIDGQGSVWWQKCGIDSCIRPTAMHFQNCKNLEMSGTKHINSQRNHISLSSCSNVIISNITISAPEQSPNTDGIDISGSTNIQIRDSNFQTGDDCIAINAGCSYIDITKLACGPGHGISVGSLGRNGQREMDNVEEIHVKNCTFNGTQNGARIKTWQGGAGYARKISFEDIILIDAENPIIIDQFYCPHNTCANDTKSAVKISDVSYIGVIGTSKTKDAISLQCSQSEACTNVVLNNVHITSAGPDAPQAVCSNVQGTSNDISPAVPCLPH